MMTLRCGAATTLLGLILLLVLATTVSSAGIRGAKRLENVDQSDTLRALQSAPLVPATEIVHVKHSERRAPSKAPTRAPSKAPSRAPSKAPSRAPSKAPSRAPTKAPSRTPSKAPTKAPTRAPSRAPSKAPAVGSVTALGTKVPTRMPSRAPAPTLRPTASPSKAPTKVPTAVPSASPSASPSSSPSASPSSSPSGAPTALPTKSPSGWAKGFGSSSSEVGSGIAVDASGNSYTTGYFVGAMTVGSTTLTAVGYQDIFMIKLDPSGSPVWAKGFGSSSDGANYGHSIAVDASGNSYTTGYFTGTMTVGSTALTAVGYQDIFMIKLDPSGSPVWAKGFGSSSYAIGFGIAVDASGDSYTTGYFARTMTVGSTTLTAVGNGDIFMIKLDSSGSPVWAKGFGGSSDKYGQGIAVDASGNSYTTGYYTGTLTVGSTTLTAVSGQDIFMIKLDSSGSPVWAKGFGSSSSNSYAGGFGIAVDASGNSYTTGSFQGTMTVGSTSITAGNQDIFMIKLDSSGSPVWAKGFGSSTKYNSNDVGHGIAVDASGNSYTTGVFQGTMTMGSTTLTAVGGYDIFIVKLDSWGSPVWAKGFGNSGDDVGRGIAMDASGNSYASGSFEGTMTVGSTTLTAVGWADIFMIKLDPSGGPAS